MENSKITWDTHWTDLKAIAVGGLVFKVEIAIYLYEVKSFEIGNYSKYFQMKTKTDNGDWWRTIKLQDLRLGIQLKPLICRKITPIPTLDMTTIGFTRQKGKKITSFVNFKSFNKEIQNLRENQDALLFYFFYVFKFVNGLRDVLTTRRIW